MSFMNTIRYLVFTLTMPNRGSWNGRWSGEDDLYAIVKPIAGTQNAQEKARTLLDGGSWYYRWDDGWGASISVQSAEGQQVRAIRKKSRGFCGYDWMANNILSHGSPKDKKELAPTEATA